MLGYRGLVKYDTNDVYAELDIVHCRSEFLQFSALRRVSALHSVDPVSIVKTVASDFLNGLGLVYAGQVAARFQGKHS
jgi:hypothetical protein